MSWIDEMCETVIQADDWPGGVIPKEAMDAFDSLDPKGSIRGDDDEVMLVQLLIDRVNELQATVDTLLKTADGVPIVPGMEVWTAYWFGVCKETIEGLCVHVVEPSIWKGGEADETQLYSTYETAEVARLKKENT